MAIKVFLLLPVALLTIGCGINADQRNFERKALSPPEGITEMTIHALPVENSEPDPSDWRISPEFYGLIEVQTPAYPNPVSFNQTLSLDLYILPGIESVNEFYIYVYRPNIAQLALVGVVSQPLNPGLLTVTLSPRQFARTGTGATNLYRIVIYDGSQNIITYGDVKVK